ncbi:MAG: 2-oxoacid:acceptor oxidoreductase family protein, partial [candidate division WOR-3 bacterium]|nr:2-oxoacid:acceptor oxidoreductase family protein [candidate division WOR-3 bacterium]
ILEIRWHGRGGQGAKTAALLFGEAALETGKYIQAFPEYGPERMGAPVVAFNRLSDEIIRTHSGIKEPDIVVVLDPTLIEVANVIEGLKDGGILLINTEETPEEIKRRYNLVGKNIKIFCVNASKIALECIGRDVPNTPMLGALVKVTGVFNYDSMMASIQAKLSEKFRGRDEIIKGNLESIKRAYQEVKSECE